MNVSRKLLALFVAAFVCSLGFITLAAPIVFVTIPSSGSIILSPGLAAFSDSACTVELASIDWGGVKPGDVVEKTFYVKNVGNGDLLVDVSADVSGFAGLSFVGDVAVPSLAVGAYSLVTVSLSIADGAVPVVFSFDVSVNGGSV